MPATPSPGDPFVNLQGDERKSPQPKFLWVQEQGPLPVADKPGYWPFDFNPQRIKEYGSDGDPAGSRDEYPANPVIAWHIWTYRDPSQSIKVPNVGATNITPRAGLEQQMGKQQSPIIFPNMITQSPADWDDTLTILPTEQPSSTAEAQRIALAQQFAGYSPQIVQ